MLLWTTGHHYAAASDVASPARVARRPETKTTEVNP